MQIKLSELVEAINNTTADTQYYYYIPEERIIIRDDDSISDSKLIALPSHKQIDDYGSMKSFIEQVEDEEAKGWLEESIKGAGAFRRFRQALERFYLTEQWIDYLDQIHENIAIDWCDYYGIEYLEDNSFNIEPVQSTPKPDKKHNYRFITIDNDNVYSLAYLCVEFRKSLNTLNPSNQLIDVDEAVEELKYYLSKNYPVFAISDNGRYIGYAVCKVDDGVVWLESIYVKKEYRRKGIGRMLYEKAESIAEEYGNDTLYQYVHPNNDEMIGFLKSKDYDVLNLIEIRKAYKDEENKDTYTIGNHTYKY